MSRDNNKLLDLRHMNNKLRRPKLSADSAIVLDSDEVRCSPTDANEIDDYSPCNTQKCQRKKDMIAGNSHPVVMSNKNTTTTALKDNVFSDEGKLIKTNDHNHESSSIFGKLDIVGDTSENRFPWQRDVFTQCETLQVRSKCTQTEPFTGVCEKCRANRSVMAVDHARELRGSSSSSSTSSPKLNRDSAISFKPSIKRVQAVRPQSSEELLEDDCFHSEVTLPQSRNRRLESNSSGSPTFTEYSSNNNKLRDMYFRHIHPVKLNKSQRHTICVSENLAQVSNKSSNSDPFLKRSQSQMDYHMPRPRFQSANSVDLPLRPSQTQLNDDRVTPSPPGSPVSWGRDENVLKRRSPQVLITCFNDDYSDKYERPFCDSIHSSQESVVSDASSLTVPIPDTLQTRAAYRVDNMVKYSSGSDNQTDEEEDLRPPPSAFRRRRGAMTSETLRTTLEVQDTLDEESENGPQYGLESRRPSANIVSLPSLQISPGDLHVVHGVSLAGLETGTSHLLANYLQVKADLGESYPSLNNSDEVKKSRSTWTLRKTKKEKEREREKSSSLQDLCQVLNGIKVKEIEDFDFSKYKSKHWSDFLKADKAILRLTDMESKRRDTVWELFKSECVYLLDHLMVMKNVFLEPLKDTQCEGHLMFIEPSKLFGNLDELCQVSLSFCKILEHGLSRASRDSEFGKTEAIVSVFYTFRTRVCPAYQRYCLNYSNALSYMERLRKQTDFLEFVKWCEQDVRCKRLQLSDLLVAPIQHITKYPLLLKNIRKKTQDQTERGSLSATIQSVESCLREMEGKVKWLTNFERLRELQQLIAWPSVDEMDSKSFIPEFLRSRLNKQSCNTILTSPKRTLLHEGPMLLSAENAKSMETYLFLLDDVLLVTKMRKISKKKSSITGEMGMMSMSSQSLPHKKDGVLFTVCKQPISVDRMEVIEVEPQDANGLKHAFVILHINRYQQVQTVLTFQAGNSNLRNKWLTHLRAAKLRVNELARHKGSDNPETQEKRSSKGRKKTL